MKNLVALITASVLTLGAGLVAPEGARACECSDPTPDEAFDGSAAVYLAVAFESDGRPRFRRGMRMPPEAHALYVLHALKGQPPRRIGLDRNPEAWSSCDASFSYGALILAFTFAPGDPPGSCDTIAAENIAAQPGVARLFAKAAKASGANVVPEGPSLGAFRQAFRVTLTPFLADRRTIDVVGTERAGAFAVGRATFSFQGAPAADFIVIESAVRLGTLSFIAGSFPAEGVRFTVLLEDDPTTGMLVYSRHVDTDVPIAAYACRADSSCTLTHETGAVNARWLAATQAQITHDPRGARADDGSDDDLGRRGCQSGAMARCIEHECVPSDFDDACTRAPLPWSE